MSNVSNRVAVLMPDNTVVSCRPCTCGSGNSLAEPHVQACELFIDYAAALTEELVYDDFELSDSTTVH